MAKDESFSVADVAALGKLLEQNRERLLAMVRRRLDPTLAARLDPEDILSEAFCEAQRRWSQFKGQSQVGPYAWLYRIVLDRLIEAWRRETRPARDRRLEVPWPEHSTFQLGLRLVADNTSPSEAAERHELRQRVQRIMEALSPHDQEILWMRVFDQLSFRDIATVLGATENAVTVRYARALRRMKNLWREVNGTGSVEP